MNIDEAAEEAISQLLPTKSRKVYEKQFFEYKTWCDEKNVDNVADEKVLLAYFLESSKKLKPSWSKYSMLIVKIVKSFNFNI